MAAVDVILRRDRTILDIQTVDESQVPAILDHIETEHQAEGLTLSVVPAGWSRFLG